MLYYTQSTAPIKNCRHKAYAFLAAPTEGMFHMEDCIFCKIAAGEIPATKVYEDEAVLAFRDLAKLAKELSLKNGFRVVNNCGPDGMQSVQHLHFHLLGGRQMGWPPFPPQS